MKDGWLERYAAALQVSPLTEDEVAALLDLARDVAHGAERRFAPLSTFLAGVAAGQGDPGARAASLRDAVRSAEDLLEDA